MFNFTGSGRRPRNVNLSGKKSTSTPSTPGLSSLRNKPTPSSSLQAARDERAAREAERRRLKAAGAIQRTWRGRKAAEHQRDLWRATLDQAISTDIDLAPNLMSLFLGIASMGRQKPRRQWSKEDLERLDKMLVVTRMWLLGKERNPDPKRNRYLRWKFGKLLVGAIDCGVVQNDTLETVLQSLAQLVRYAPQIANDEYYSALSKVTVSATLSDTLLYALIEALTNPLQRPKDGEPKSEADLDAAYRAFDTRYLTTPNLVSLLGDSAIKKLSVDIDLWKAASCCSLDLETESKLWLLSHIIYFTRHGRQVVDLTGDVVPKLPAVQEEYINFVSRVLSSVAVEVGQRIDIEDYVMEEADEEVDSDDEAKPAKQPSKSKREPLPVFVKQQIESLVQQSTITSLLSSTKSTDGNVQVLAGFALTLLLVFPAKRTDMRFWLCVALTSDGVPAVKYVWNAVKKSQLFASIKNDSFAAIDPLKYPPVNRGGISAKSVEEQWNLIFLFLEMYSFVLVTGDDHEFLQGKGRQLALSEVSQLTLFLKNLAFAMYWWFGEIMGEDKTKDNSAEVYFRVQETGRAWELSYFRSVVTDVLKAIYTRDSRRHFLPDGYWLMEKYLTLDGFITAVVQEEENRQAHLAAEDDSDSEDDERVDRDAWVTLDASTRRHLELARREKARKKKQRMNFLSAIGPRSEIVQNLPFMIPFEKRVEIFREFVAKDKQKRRAGAVDPDQWRFSMGGGREGRERLQQHHAVIRRKHEFEDAFTQYWKLGEALKEPIQITFVDKFGAEEAGIDGGGVTKEFLTGVCGEAFSPSAEVPEDEDDEEYLHGIPFSELGMKSMFKENPEHLLYPNPTMLEEVKYKLQKRNDPKVDQRQTLIEILNRYEFCGRILGKCLYEGILVDLSFAPFFLLKWSQPSSASAVGVNDLRDLDAEMYRHLMALMDFEGDVEFTFNLDFTITTQIAPGKIETYNLKPNGDSIPVTNANRLEYVHLVSKHRLVKEPALQTAAFLKGLTKIINPHWLKMFNQSELQTLVGGDVGNPIDVEDLRKHTIYGGVYQIGDDGQEHETIKLFWKVMHELDDTDRRKVLRFVTSVSRAPLLGFKVLSPRFCIRDAGDDQTRLCSASTCVNLLKLPRYKDLKTLKEKLLYSVHSNAGFDLS